MSPRNAEKQDTFNRLYKSRKDRIIDGVCGGVAEYLHVHPAFVRVAWLVLLFINGLGVVLYLAGMILMPVNPVHKQLKPEEKTKRYPELYGGIFLVFVGLLLLSNWVYDCWGWHFPFGYCGHGLWPFPWKLLLPISLILIGIAYAVGLIQRHPERGGETAKVEKTGKTLFRSEKEKMIGGVCGGLGLYFRIDPTLVRLLYVLFTIGTSFIFGILLYIALLIFIPKKEK